MFRLYYADVSDLQDTSEYEILSTDRRNKLSLLRPSLNRKQSIGAELLLIRALLDMGVKATLPLNIHREPEGKPYCPDLPVHFSFSHSGVIAACALADEPVGLDVQIISEFPPRLAERFFTQDEQSYIREGEDQALRFTEIWTRKESRGKLTGKGLLESMKNSSVLNPVNGCEFWTRKIGEYTFSLCASQKQPIPEQIIRIELP